MIYTVEYRDSDGYCLWSLSPSLDKAREAALGLVKHVQEGGIKRVSYMYLLTEYTSDCEYTGTQIRFNITLEDGEITVGEDRP